jgi:RimJ/RimL family protein N-acetyltransferase
MSRLQAPPPIATERLLLRLVEEGDLADLLIVNGDDEVTRCLPYASWQSHADAQAWFKRMSRFRAEGSAWQIAIVLKESRVVIGTCALFGYEEDNRRAELGYVLGRAYWGKGLMHEALTALITHLFRATHLRRLDATVDSQNPASERVMARLGFTREGVLRERWRTREKDGITDAVIYGLLRREWPGASA